MTPNDFQSKNQQLLNDCRQQLEDSGNLKRSIKEALLDHFNELEELAANFTKSMAKEVQKTAKKLADTLINKQQTTKKSNPNTQTITPEQQKLNSLIAKPKTFAEIVNQPVKMQRLPEEEWKQVQAKRNKKSDRNQNNNTVIFKSAPNADQKAMDVFRAKVNPYEMGLTFVKEAENGTVLAACSDETKLKALTQALAGNLEPVLKKQKRLPNSQCTSFLVDAPRPT